VSLRQGSKVTQITKKVGQVPRMGKVVEIHGEHVEVKWDDGKTTITSRSSLTLVHHK